MKKNILIEASNLIDAHPTGIPVYSRNLVQQLSDLQNNPWQFDLSLLLSASRWKRRKLCPDFNEVQKHWFLKRFILKGNIDLIHYTGVFTNHIRRVPKIITIHDIAVLKPEHQLPYYTSRETIEKTRENMKNIAKYTQSIIFVSKTTKQDFLNLYSFPEEKTHVVYLGSNFEPENINDLNTNILERHKLISKKYYLFVGGISIRKNVLNLVKAFLLNEHKSDFDLVLAGNQGMGAEIILEEIRRLDKRGKIKITGFVTDNEIQELYKNAGAFAFPTYYEGFGMPLIDAMNFKIPVLTSNKGAAPEITGTFAKTADPFDVSSISNGLKEVLQINQETLERAKAHAQTFTWQRCAKQTLKVYKNLTE